MTELLVWQIATTVLAGLCGLLAMFLIRARTDITQLRGWLQEAHTAIGKYAAALSEDPRREDARAVDRMKTLLEECNARRAVEDRAHRIALGQAIAEIEELKSKKKKDLQEE